MTDEGPRYYAHLTGPSALPAFERGEVANHIQYYLSVGGSENGLGLGSFGYIRCGGRSHHVQRATGNKKTIDQIHCFLPISVSRGTACGIALALVALHWRLVEVTPKQYSTDTVPTVHAIHSLGSVISLTAFRVLSVAGVTNEMGIHRSTYPMESRRRKISFDKISCSGPTRERIVGVCPLHRW